MSGGGSGGGSVTPVQTQQTSSSKPWKKQQPFLVKGFEAAESEILNQPTSYFPGQTFASFTPQQLQALGAQEQRALAGSPLTGAAQQATLDTLSGDYLNNPFQQQLIDSITASVKPAVDAGFGLRGRAGSPLHAEAMARGVTRAVAPLAFQDYRTGRGEMMNAASQAPGLAREDYYDIGQLMGAGGAFQSQEQARIAEDMARFNYGQMEPYQRLAAYSGLVGGNYGGTTTTTGTQLVPSTTGANPLMMGLGGLMALSSVAGNVAPLFNMGGGGGMMAPIPPALY